MAEQNDYQRYVRFDDLNSQRNDDHDGAHFSLAEWQEYADLAQHFGYLDTFGYCQARIAQLGLTLAPAQPDENVKARMWYEGHDAYLLASDEGYYEYEMASLAAAKETEKQCGTSITYGPAHDPYGSTCDLDRGHEGPHEGPDPLGIGKDDRLQWTGGGSCVGDPLPYHIVHAA